MAFPYTAFPFLLILQTPTWLRKMRNVIPTNCKDLHAALYLISGAYTQKELSWFTEALDHKQDEHTVQCKTSNHRRKSVGYGLAKQQIFSKQGLLMF